MPHVFGLESGCLEDKKWAHICGWKLVLATGWELGWNWLEGLISSPCGLLRMVAFAF